MERDFSKYSDSELIDAFNSDVWNEWWASWRADFLTWIHEEFIKRNIDFSVIWDEKTLSLRNKVRLIDSAWYKVLENI